MRASLRTLLLSLALIPLASCAVSSPAFSPPPLGIYGIVEQQDPKVIEQGTVVEVQGSAVTLETWNGWRKVVDWNQVRTYTAGRPK